MSQHDFIRIDMPSAYCAADATWIQEQLQKLPVTLRRRVALKYEEVYEAAYDAEPVSYRQENRARHEANVRLRKFVETHGRAIQGYMTLPPLAGAQRS